MDKAKTEVMGFLNKHGKHDTSVHETVNSAVTNETINEHHHDNVITAKDKEVHQDHYHTTVQPIQDQQTLPEQHHYNTAAVEHRKFEHGNDEEVERRLRAERAKFQDTTTKGQTKHTTSNVEPIVGEHVHHHVHENIQPVVNRQVIEPHVTHTTIPIHEVHHSAAQHHGSSALPAMSMADFKKSGGSLGGREQRNDFFEGEPRSMQGHKPLTDNASSEFRHTGHVDLHANSAAKGGHGAGLGAGAGLAGGAVAGTAAHGHRSGRDRRGSSSSVSSSDEEKRRTKKTGLAGGLTGSHGTHSTSKTAGATGVGNLGTNGASHGTTATGTSGPLGHTNGTTTGTSGVNASPTAKKPSLLDRLNPMKDADGDGKKGLMD